MPWVWGFGITAIGCFLFFLELRWHGEGSLIGVFLLLPGLVPALFIAIAGGNVHDPSETIIFSLTPIFNVLIYAAVVYLIPRWRWLVGKDSKL